MRRLCKSGVDIFSRAVIFHCDKTDLAVVCFRVSGFQTCSGFKLLSQPMRSLLLMLNYLVQ